MEAYMAVLLVFGFTLYHSITPSTAYAYSGIDGDYILTLGNQNNFSELQLIGKIYKNFERNLSEAVKDARIEHFFSELCEAYECGKWSTWSECSGKKGLFGHTRRSRTCGRNISSCAFNDTQERVEKESVLCLSRKDPTFVPTPETTTTTAATTQSTTEATTQPIATTVPPVQCPSPFDNVHDICLQLITAFTYSHTQATMLCQWGGGSLVHVDTFLKNKALTDLLAGYWFNSTVWIDGKRVSANEDWIYTGEEEPAFDAWLPGQPESGANVCKADSWSAARRGWEALPCPSQFNFVCEHPPLY